MGKHFDSFYRGYFVGEMESALLQVKRDREKETEEEQGVPTIASFAGVAYILR